MPPASEAFIHDLPSVLYLHIHGESLPRAADRDAIAHSLNVPTYTIHIVHMLHMHNDFVQHKLLQSYLVFEQHLNDSSHSSTPAHLFRVHIFYMYPLHSST